MATQEEPVVEKVTGGCLCGRLLYEVAGPYRWFSSCHCTKCQRHTGSAFKSVASNEGPFQLLRGSDNTEVTEFKAAQGHPYAGFCSTCGTMASFPGYVLAGTLHADLGIGLTYIHHCKFKAPWHRISDPMLCHEAFPGSDACIDLDTKSADAPARLTGGCLCGGVQFEVMQFEEHVRRFYQCHCVPCRLGSFAALSVNLVVGERGFTWTRGTELLRTYQHPESGWAKSFCRTCISLLPTKLTNTDEVRIPAGTLDTDPGVRPTQVLFADRKPAWHTLTEGLEVVNGPPDDSPASSCWTAS